MINISMPNRRYAKPQVEVERKDYTVVKPMTHKHVMVEVGSVLSLSEAEAKYHQMAGRIAPVASAVVAPAIEAFDGDHDH